MQHCDGSGCFFPAFADYFILSTIDGMINSTELAVCRRRGHKASLLGDGWAQCKWCGTWIREVRTIQEREDAPPEDEQGLLAKAAGTKDLLSKLEGQKVDLQKKKKKGKKK